MKNFTFKTLAMAALLAVSGSAGAAVGDVTTQANIDFSNDIAAGAVAGTVNSMVLSGNFELGYNNENTDVLRVGNGTGSVTISEENLAGTRDEVVITFDMYYGSLSGKSAGFYLYDTDNTVIGGLYISKYSGTEVINSFGVDRSKITAVGSSNAANAAIVAASNKSTFEIHLDYAAGTMYLKQYTDGTLKQTTSKVAMGSTKPLKKFEVGSNYNNTDRRCWFDNLLIQTIEGDYNVATADYTVKYVCGDEEVKTADVRTGDVGSDITLYASDKQNFFNADESKRYIYVSDDAEGKKVVEGDGTVVTVTVREAEKWSYTVTSSYTVDENKNTLDWSTSGEVWEDLNTIDVYYPRYQAYGTTLVGRAPVSNDLKTSVTVENDAYTTDLAYTSTSENITDLYLLAEAETLGVGTQSATTFSGRVSGGKMIYGSAGTLVTLPAGKYIFTVGAIGGANNKENTITVKAGVKTVAEGTCTGNFLTLFTGEEFVVTRDTPITFTASNSNSDRGIDLIYVRSTGEPTEEELAAASLDEAKFDLQAAITDAKAIETEGKLGTDDLSAAITEAETAAAAEDATVESLAAALAALNTAVAAFNDANTTKYYIVGSMNNWTVSDDYKLVLNEEASTTEYIFSSLAMESSAQFKVVGALGGNITTWYPDDENGNYTITADGNYTVYFRPNGDGGDGWHYNVIYVTAVPEPEPEIAYYVVGTMTDWQANEDYKLSVNPNNSDEYMLTKELPAETNLKVIKVVEGQETVWYPDGENNNYVVSSKKTYDIYFRPDGKGGEGWHYGYIYLVQNTTVGISAAKVAAENGVIYNLAGQQVKKAVKGLYIVNGKKIVVK